MIWSLAIKSSISLTDQRKRIENVNITIFYVYAACFGEDKIGEKSNGAPKKIIFFSPVFP